MLAALGGASNLGRLEASALTRVRAVVTDAARVDEDALRAAGALGPVAIVLSGGVVIYSEPAPSPLEPGHPLPGGVLAARNDLEAILENLEPGMPVYFH